MHVCTYVSECLCPLIVPHDGRTPFLFQHPHHQVCPERQVFLPLLRHRFPNILVTTTTVDHRFSHTLKSNGSWCETAVVGFSPPLRLWQFNVRTYFRFARNVPFRGQIVRLHCLPTGYASPSSTESAARSQRGDRQPKDVQKHHGRGESLTRREIYDFISRLHLDFVVFPISRSIAFELISRRSCLSDHRSCPYSELVKAQRSGCPTPTATTPQQQACTEMIFFSL